MVWGEGVASSLRTDVSQSNTSQLFFVFVFVLFILWKDDTKRASCFLAGED